MSFCNNCGNRLAPNAAVCPVCGAPQQVQAQPMYQQPAPQQPYQQSAPQPDTAYVKTRDARLPCMVSGRFGLSSGAFSPDDGKVLSRGAINWGLTELSIWVFQSRLNMQQDAAFGGESGAKPLGSAKGADPRPPAFLLLGRAAATRGGSGCRGSLEFPLKRKRSSAKSPHLSFAG